MSDNDINSSASALQIPSNAGGTESVKDLIKEVRSALISFFQVGKFQQKNLFFAISISACFSLSTTLHKLGTG